MSAILNIVDGLQYEADWLRDAVICGCQLFIQNGGVYQPLAEDAAIQRIARYVQQNPGLLVAAGRPVEPSPWILNGVLTNLKAKARTISETDWNTFTRQQDAGEGPFIAVPGGMLDLGRDCRDEDRLLPPSTEFLAKVRLPVAPDFRADCRRWRQFLHETFSANLDTIDLLAEIFGYLIWPDCRFERFFVFYGPANSGKSLILKLALRLLGAENVSAVPLRELGQKFAIAPLENKLTNIEFEASFDGKINEALLKSIVSGEPISVEEKYKTQRMVTLRAKLLVATNELPKFNDRSDGIWRRLCAVRCPNIVAPADRDRQLLDRLENEMPAILAWAIRGLQRLLQQDDFTPATEVQALVKECRVASNPVALFIRECCHEGDGLLVVKEALFEAYKSWALRNFFKVLNKAEFCRDVAQLVSQPRTAPREHRRTGPRCFSRVALRVAARQTDCAPRGGDRGGAAENRRNILDSEEI